MNATARVFTPLRILVATGVLWLVHLGVILGWGVTAPGPAVSMGIQLLLACLCVLASFHAPAGADRFERRFLRLVALRYLICAVGQILGAYGTSDLTPYQGSPADVVFHVEDVPMGIALLLDPGTPADREQRVSLRDLLQMVIFCLAIYAYFRTMPTLAAEGLDGIAAADVVVAAAFYFRAMSTRSNLARALFGRWTPALMLSTVNAAYSGYPGSPGAGERFDLIWVMETVAWILTAVTWVWPRDREANADLLPPIDRTVQLLPVVVCCFVLVVAVGIAQEHLGLAAALAAASIACLRPSHLALIFGRRTEGAGGVT
jgi:hypothetical protein